MFDVRMVELLSDGVLNKEKIILIWKNYKDLCQFYPGIRR